MHEPAPAAMGGYRSDTDRRRFMTAAAVGSVCSLVVFVAMLAGPEGSLVTDRGVLSTFLDAQARAILHGHLSVPPGQASIEGFVIHGRTYLYFGVAPSLLRAPILLVTHSLDGHLTQLSMLLAFVVLMLATAVLQWQVRAVAGPDGPIVRGEIFVAGLMQLLVGAGSIVLYLASWPVVYHETELWGLTLAVAGLAAALAVLRDATPGRIVLAGAIGLAAMNSRPSVGLVPELSLLVVAAVYLRRRLRDATLTRRARRIFAGMVIASIVPLASAAALEYAKFDTFGLPVGQQVGVQLDPTARAAISANHGSLFGLKFVPSTLLAVLRPDAVGTVRGFPFVGFPNQDPTILGHPLFESLQPSLSAPTSMTLLCLLTLVGLPPLVRRRQLRPLAGMMLATLIAFAPVLTNADIATRYLSDAVPLLVLGSLVGVQRVLAWQASAERAPLRVGLIVAAVALCAWGIVVNGGTGLVLQRLAAPDTRESDRGAFVHTQEDIDRFLGRRPSGIARGPAVPSGRRGPIGSLFVVGHCAGLYTRSFGGSWLPVERTPASGLHELTLRLPSVPITRAEALLTLGQGRTRATVTIAGARAAARFAIRVGGREQVAAPPVSLAAKVRVTVSVDPFAGRYSATLSVDGRRLLAALLSRPYATRSIGSDPGHGVAPFSGELRAVPLTAPICNELARRARLFGA